MQIETQTRGPVGKVLGVIAAIAVIALAATLGIVVLAVLLGLALIGAVVTAARIWWLRRQMRAAGFDPSGPQPGAGAGQRTRRPPRQGHVIEGEYQRGEPDSTRHSSGRGPGGPGSA